MLAAQFVLPLPERSDFRRGIPEQDLSLVAQGLQDHLLAQEGAFQAHLRVQGRSGFSRVEDQRVQAVTGLGTRGDEEPAFLGFAQQGEIVGQVAPSAADRLQEVGRGIVELASSGQGGPQVREYRQDVRVILVPVQALVDFQGPPIQRHGLRETAQGVLTGRDIIEARGHCRVILTRVKTLVCLQGLLIQRQGLCKTAQRLQIMGHVVEAHGHEGMVLIWVQTSGHLQGSLAQGQGLRRAPQAAQTIGHVVETSHRIRMVPPAEQSLGHHQGLPVQAQGLVQAAQVLAGTCLCC
jgi:hypothetical protein